MAFSRYRRGVGRSRCQAVGEKTTKNNDHWTGWCWQSRCQSANMHGRLHFSAAMIWKMQLWKLPENPGEPQIYGGGCKHGHIKTVISLRGGNNNNRSKKTGRTINTSIQTAAQSWICTTV